MEAKQSSGIKPKEISFNFGQISHQEFGKSNGELRGKIPLVPSSGYSNSSTPILDPVVLKALVKEAFQESHHIWEEELDEDILLIIEKYILLSAFLCPHIAVDDQRRKEFKMVIKFWLTADAVNAYCKEEADSKNFNLDLKTIDPEGKEVRLMRVIGVSLSNGEVDEEDLPTLTPALKQLLPQLLTFVKDLKAITPDFKIKFKPFKKAAEKSFYAALFPKKEDGIEAQPRSTDASVWRCFSLSFVELIVLLENVWISEEIRKDLLFREWVEALTVATGLLNPIFTVKEAMELNIMRYSELLTGIREGTTLQESFDDIYNRMMHFVTISVNTGEKLHSKYSQDYQLNQYIRLGEDTLNGHVFWYSYLHNVSKSDLNGN